jgi:hypothetical protein
MTINKKHFFFQGARFNNTTMFSAREAIIPGGIYDRSRLNVTNQTALRMSFVVFF